MDIKTLTENYISDLGTLAKTEAMKSSLEAFKTRGLPHTKMEDWLYTKVHDVLPSNFSKVDSKTTLKSVKVAGKYQIIFLNGQYSKVDSFVPDEVKVEIVDSSLELDNYDNLETDIFANLNGAVEETTLTITLEKNYVCDDVISIVHLSDFSEKYQTPRVKLVANKFSKADLVEIFKGKDNTKYNTVACTFADIEDGAKVTYTRVQTEGNEAFFSGSVYANVKRDASFQSFTFNTGALKARHNLQVNLVETGAYGSVDGLYALTGDQHCDNFSNISHDKEHTESSQLFKGVLDDKTRGVFTGRVLVQRDAQQVNSEQLNKNLLLSKKAHADTRPQLEVYADDVKCAHGATVGQMSEEEAFYLQSRGLSSERAQKMLIHAFCSDVLMKVENEKIQEFLSNELYESFEKTAFEHIDNKSEEA